MDSNGTQTDFAVVGNIVLRFLCWGVLFAANTVAAADDQIRLTGKQWTVWIEPSTLAVICAPLGQPTCVISSPQKGLGRVADEQVDQTSARWDLPAAKLRVEMRLDERDALNVQFVASESGACTWPVVGPERAYRAFILPLFEGLYVPANDREWSEFLEKDGPHDTAGDLSMPFWGIDLGGHTLTYVLTNPFNNQLAFHNDSGRLGLALTHQFTANNPVKQFGFTIELGANSPVEPARIYREDLIRSGEFVTLKKKIERTPDAAKLLGAAHIYLWGDGLIGREDLAKLKLLAGRIVAAANRNTVAGRVYALVGPEIQQRLAELGTKQWVDNYDRGQVADALGTILKRRDFCGESLAGSGLSIEDEAKRLIARGISNLSDAEVCRLNCLLLHDAFADVLPPVETWGEGWSPKLIQSFADAGLDRLWLGSPSWDGLRLHPDSVRKAISLGYLVAPYDSFHSIHSPAETDTWETAQFDAKLYETGAVVRADGTKKKGFLKKGYILSDVAGRPWVERRVSDLFRQFQCNSWFIDCDADGELYDDYSPLHPATQADQMNARLSRLAWIRDTFGLVIGSEGGAAYAAGTIHFAHGIMTPVIGWGDPDLKDRSSPYFLGGYYPPDGPTVFFKQVPMKPVYRRIYADPRFRLPLYETVFHDSVVATHQWGYGSLKFTDDDHARELLELLYDVPPLYHLNRAEWDKRKALILAHYRFFSPLHREAGLLPMTDFQWLTDDHLVQKTTFGDALELVANFGAQPFDDRGITVPPRAVLSRHSNSGDHLIYLPLEPTNHTKK